MHGRDRNIVFPDREYLPVYAKVDWIVGLGKIDILLMLVKEIGV